MKQVNSVNSLENAVTYFRKIPQYKDSLSNIKQCEDLIKQLKKKTAEEEREKEENRKKSTKIKYVIGSLTVIVITVVIILSVAIHNKDKYNHSLELIENKKYVEAISVLEEIRDYKNSEELLVEAKYSYAKQLFDNKEFTKAKDEFSILSALDYKDSENYITLCVEQINEENYQKALLLIKENKIIDGYNLLNELSVVEYKDSKTLLENLKVSYDRALFNEKLKSLDFGSVVTFGSYEQDDNLENGKEPVEWIIIDRNESSVMLISKKIIDVKAFNEGTSDATWGTSSLRKWLNGTFYNNAFNDYEKQSIAETRVIPDKKAYSTSPDQGKETIDKVYLLSGDEYEKYRKITGVGTTITTKYAIALNDRMEPFVWFLRSIDDDYSYLIESVRNSYYGSGNITTGNNFIDSGVRPVIWIEFK